MQGAMLPIKWGEDVQQQVAKHLGFDPENPAIKMEMSQILSKGGAGQGAKIKVAQADIDTLLAGYSETAAGETEADAPADTAPSESETQASTAEASETNEPVPTAPNTNAASEDTAINDNRQGRFRPLLLIFGGAAAFILAAGLVILLRSRGNS